MGAERLLYFCFKGNRSFSQKNISTCTCAAHPLPAGGDCTAFIRSLLNSFRVYDSCYVDSCGISFVCLRAFSFSAGTLISNRLGLSEESRQCDVGSGAVPRTLSKEELNLQT